MNANIKKAREIFVAAVAQVTPEHWDAYLAEACGEDAELRNRVRHLLQVHRDAGSFLDSPAPGLAATVDATPVREGLGAVIGPFKLMEQIGEGGMGLVFVAEQQRPVRRKVALKLIKPGMDTREVIARFEAERQALALMDHPNIARVFDAGETESGRPYFVMELVRGIAITEFCDQSHLPVRDRLGLFVLVCQAVQHAHQKGIIHRDLKPSNVLVTLHDGTPVVKVIDFGVAKAIGQQLTDKTIYTRFAQMIGTPLYMSPEQAEMSGLDMDTRTDIYALGVLLYELLTGTTPFDKERLRTATYDEIRRIIREEEPPRPSTRLSTTDELPSIAANRALEPNKLSGLVRGELDWIVMKCLEKDRNRRYESASALAKDVDRYLHDEPVLACPPSVAYRFRKFARRHRAALAMASVVVVALLLVVAGLAVSTLRVWQANEGLQQALKGERRSVYVQTIALAEREWSASNSSRALELLKQCPEEFRGWEWRYLQRLQGKSLPPLRHDAALFSAAVSSDGKRIASADEDGFIKIWDARSGQEIRRFRGHDKPCWCVAWSPDSVCLASGDFNGWVKIWDAYTGEKRRAWQIPNSGIDGLAFNPADGSRLACSSSVFSGSQDNGKATIAIWDVLTGQRLLVLGEQERAANGVAFSPDGRLLASASQDRTVKLWDAQTSKALRTFGGDMGFWCAAFSPDGRLLAGGSGGADEAQASGSIMIWEVETGRERPPLTGHGAKCLAFTPDGARLATGGTDQAVRLWDPSSGQEVLTLRGHTDWVRSVAFTPDGQRLVSASDDRTLRIWDARPWQEGEKSGDEVFTLRGHADSVNAVAFHPRQPQLATASSDGTVKFWDTQTGQELRTLRGTVPKVLAMAFSPDGQRLAIGGTPNDAAIVLDAATGQELRRFAGHTDGVYSVAWSPDGKRLASGSAFEVVMVSDVTTGAVVHRLQAHSWAIMSVAFSPDQEGKVLATVGSDGLVRLWDTKTGRESAPSPLKHQGSGAGVAFSPDDQLLASSGYDMTVRIWQTNSWKQVEVFHDQTGGAQGVSFSPDGRLLAWGSSDSTVRVWNRSSGEIYTLRGHLKGVRTVAFSPDGKLLASASQDGTVKIWPAPATK